MYSNERRLPVLGLLAYRRRSNSTNNSYCIKSDLNRQDAIALEYCAIYECFNCYIHPFGRYINYFKKDIQQSPHNRYNTQFWPNPSPLQDTFSACVVQFIRDEINQLKSTDLFYAPIGTMHQLQPRVWHL